jgi:hypothetical protein
MRAHRVVTLIAPAILLALLQLIAAIVDPLIGLFVGAIVGGLAWGAQIVLSFDFVNWWESGLFALAASVIGIGVRLLTTQQAHPVILFALAPVLAGGVASLWHLITKDDSRRCDLCNHRLKAGFFDCPRCGKIVCEERCWNFDGCQCGRCEETNVPVLNMDKTWWERQLGPRIRRGRCQLCMTPADKTDLRNCGRCGRPYCRTCWDAVNGQCRSCLWIIPGIPVRLMKYLVADEFEPRTQRASRAATRSTRIR